MTEIYQVKVKGALDAQWSDWFTDMTVEVESASDRTSITTLTGPVADQARLRGIVSKIWDLNLTVISVTQIEPEKRRRHSQSHSEPGGEVWENS